MKSFSFDGTDRQTDYRQFPFYFWAAAAHKKKPKNCHHGGSEWRIERIERDPPYQDDQSRVSPILPLFFSCHGKEGELGIKLFFGLSDNGFCFFVTFSSGYPFYFIFFSRNTISPTPT